MATRLTENHPLSKKVDALMQYLEDNNLMIEQSPYNRGFLITDTKENVEAYMKDLDSYEGVEALPAAFEFKLIKAE